MCMCMCMHMYVRRALLVTLLSAFFGANFALGYLRMSGAQKKRRIDGLVEAIDEAKAELDEREASLERREEQLKKAIEGVGHEKKLMAGRAPSDVLQLNIGGTNCTVSRRTLCQFEPSLLAAKFSGRWDDSVEKDADGRFFIDQPAELFMPLVDFLRAKAIETPEAAPVRPPYIGEVKIVASIEAAPSLRAISDFRRVLEYYGMTPYVYQLAASLRRGQPENASFVAGVEPGANCTNWSTCVLTPLHSHHERRVVSFSVTLDSVERPQIGWAASNFAQQLQAGELKGVGEDGYSIALDGLRGGVCINGAVHMPLDALTLQAGSVVTCERKDAAWRWLVDGREVAVVKQADVTKLADPCPAISGKGHWRVTQYTFEK